MSHWSALPGRRKAPHQSRQGSAPCHIKRYKVMHMHHLGGLVGSKSMVTALFAHEIAQMISSKVGIRADYIDVYPSGNGCWDASLRAVPNVWTPAKKADVKQLARAFKAIYGLKRAAG